MAEMERPPITQEHMLFGERIVTIARQTAELTVASVVEKADEPPTEEALRYLSVTSNITTDYSGDGIRRHLDIPGDIAGSDAFRLHGIWLPEEAYATDDAGFPGRILDISLLYGDLKPDYLLYAGRETPPVLASKERVAPLRDYSWMALSSLDRYMQKLPESSFIFPSEKELRTIRQGLEAAKEHIDNRRIIEDSLERARCEVEESNNAALIPTLNWLRNIQ